MKSLQRKNIEDFQQKKSCFNESNLAEFLDWINPKIGSWLSFVEVFSGVLKKNLEILEGYLKGRVLMGLKGVEKERLRIVVMIYKNLCILVNLKEIFEGDGELGLETFEANDHGDYLKMWESLGC